MTTQSSKESDVFPVYLPPLFRFLVELTTWGWFLWATITVAFTVTIAGVLTVISLDDVLLRNKAERELTTNATVTLERMLRDAIRQFEPRLLAHSVKVRVATASDQMNRNAITFEITGDLWAQPIPLQLFLRTDVDLETGQVSVESSTQAQRSQSRDASRRSG